MFRPLVIALMTPLVLAGSAVVSSVCSSDMFSLSNLFGTRILDVSAQEVLNYTRYSLQPGTSVVTSPVIDFCNVSVTYEHPGWNDTVVVSVWLPLQSWNGRLQALGGGGYSATFGPMYLTQAVSAGYAAIGSDAGLGGDISIAQDPSTWALTSPGNVNLYNLENYGSRSLEEMTIIGKSIVQTYYGTAPKYSYFSGCSGGGRQGLMIAQRFPDLHDGILAVAPAINIESFIPAGYWATQVMNEIGYYPPPCEIDAFTQEAIAACDTLDGLKDGIIEDIHECNFTAHDVVGKSLTCDNSTLQFTSEGAAIVQAAWTGPLSPSGREGWFGLNKDASLTTTYITTQCVDGDPSNCTAGSADLTSSWIRYFLAKDAAWDASNMTQEQFFDYIQSSRRSYGSMLSASSPDLGRFKNAGGKMISWHGGADEAIPPNGSIAYYQQVLKTDSSARDYFRFFEAPGVGHCIGGAGPIPNRAFDALVQWVEGGIIPDNLTAVSQTRAKDTRPLCAYPFRQKHSGTNESDAVFQCVDVALEEDGDIADQFPFYDSL